VTRRDSQLKFDLTRFGLVRNVAATTDDIGSISQSSLLEADDFTHISVMFDESNLCGDAFSRLFEAEDFTRPSAMVNKKKRPEQYVNITAKRKRGRHIAVGERYDSFASALDLQQQEHGKVGRAGNLRTLIIFAPLF
jgi:hypothetical protein